MEQHNGAVVYAAHDGFYDVFFADCLVSLPVGVGSAPEDGMKVEFLSDYESLFIEFALGGAVKVHLDAVFFFKRGLQIHDVFFDLVS